MLSSCGEGLVVNVDGSEPSFCHDSKWKRTILIDDNYDDADGTDERSSSQDATTTTEQMKRTTLIATKLHSDCSDGRCTTKDRSLAVQWRNVQLLLAALKDLITYLEQPPCISISPEIRMHSC